MKINCDQCGRPLRVNWLVHLLGASSETEYLCAACYRAAYAKWKIDRDENALESCQKCYGVGRIHEFKCEKCGGTGKQSKGFLFRWRSVLFSRFEGVKKGREA